MIASIPCDVSLNAEGWFSPVDNPNGQPFQYFVYAACVTEVELDVLSGDMHILSSDIVYDCGKSLNPAVDTLRTGVRALSSPFYEAHWLTLRKC